MKRNHFLVFLWVLLVALSAIAVASADAKPRMRVQTASQTKAFGNEDKFYILKNGKTASFLLLPENNSSLLYPLSTNDLGLTYSDILFDCNGKVSAKTSAKWIKIKKYAGGCIISWETNNSLASRTATITVKGNNYKAKIKLIQAGTAVFKTAVLDRGTITVTFAFPKDKRLIRQSLYISCYRMDEDGSNIHKNIEISLNKEQTSSSFRVESGWMYEILLATTYKFGKDSAVWSTSSDTIELYLDSLSILDEAYEVLR